MDVNLVIALVSLVLICLFFAFLIVLVWRVYHALGLIIKACEKYLDD